MALTSKQEQVAQAIAIQGLLAEVAYSRVYNVTKMSPKMVKDKADALVALPEVQARITVLRDRALTATQKKDEYDLAAAIEEADGLIEDARSLGQIGAAVTAATLKSRLAGHLVERKEVTQKGILQDADEKDLVALQREIEVRLKLQREAAELTGAPVHAPIQGNQPVRRKVA